MENLSTVFLEYAALDRRRTQDGLTVPELERWSRLKRLLTQRFSPGLDPREVDRRRSVRVPTRLRVRYESEGGFARSHLTNLSRGGAFVQTECPLPVGTGLLLHIEVEPKGEELEIPGQVAQSYSGPSFEPGRTGMGIRFLEMAEESEKRLADLYEMVIEREFGAGSKQTSGSELRP